SAIGDAAEVRAAGPGERGSPLGSVDERGARGDPQAAPRGVRAAARERDLEGGERVFREGARPGPAEGNAFVESGPGRLGVEPICEALGVSVSAYYQRR